MMNQCNFIGRVGKPPELRYTPNGDAVATLSIACSEKFKNKQGEKQEKTEWINLTFWRGLAEIVGKYVTKGQLIYVSGKMQTRKYQDRDGNDRYSTEIVVSDMKMLGGSGDSQSRGQDSHNTAKSNGYQPQQEQAPQFDGSDDIPF